ncbi:MAG: UDP-3-O-(3-hydroxymyristoyl)glucosamine N-acyltransferase [Phycisphaerae bacterium]|nr:UDP-3-O-(3-hydroxymyristoyl)glucosamine N-acyltransferase [Phycisphaerae bacterium]
MRIAEIVERFGGVCEGDELTEIKRIVGTDLAGPGDMTFAFEEKSLGRAEASGASCVIVPPELRRSPTTLLRCGSVQQYVAELMRFFHPQPSPTPGIHPSAVIGEGTRIDESASIGPQVSVGANCRIGATAVLMASVVVEDDCEIGADTIIHPHVCLYPRTHIGARVIIHAGAVIGADGFGYFQEDGGLHKWPHVGNVVIEDDVEIGANTCIDRGKFGATLIKKGTKIDNLVQIAHNCSVGPATIIAAQAGMGGSSVLEAGVICAGQAGIRDHKTVGRGVRIGAQSGILDDVPPGTEMFGYPAKPIHQAMQEIAFLGYLTKHRTPLRKLIKTVETPQPAADVGRVPPAAPNVGRVPPAIGK